jgi:hypothetical protein
MSNRLLQNNPFFSSLPTFPESRPAASLPAGGTHHTTVRLDRRKCLFDIRQDVVDVFDPDAETQHLR